MQMYAQIQTPTHICKGKKRKEKKKKKEEGKKKEKKIVIYVKIA